MIRNKIRISRKIYPNLVKIKFSKLINKILKMIFLSRDIIKSQINKIKLI